MAKVGRKNKLDNPMYRTFYIPESTVNKIKSIAKKDKVSLSEVVTNAVEAFNG